MPDTNSPKITIDQYADKAGVGSCVFARQFQPKLAVSYVRSERLLRTLNSGRNSLSSATYIALETFPIKQLKILQANGYWRFMADASQFKNQGTQPASRLFRTS